MRRKTIWLLPALAAFAAAPASPLPAPATPPAAAALAQDPDDLVDEIIDEYTELYEAYLVKARAAQTREEQLAARELFPDGAAFGGRLMKVAEAHPRTEAAARALVWIVQRDRQRSDAAMEVLMRDHKASPHMAEVVSRVKDEAVLVELLEKSPSDTVRGVACYSLAQLKKDTDEKAYLALLQRCVKEFADVPYGRSTLGSTAEGAIFEIEHLSVGKVAPEIEGEDVDGVPFKLSDYRGKVVMIDFWGHW